MRKAPVSQCRPVAPKTTARSVAATAAPISTSAWLTRMECRLANPESVRARGRQVYPPVPSAVVAREARPHRAQPVYFVGMQRCSTAAKSPAQASARNSPRCVPRSGRPSVAVTGATTATTAWRTRMVSRFGTAACARTLRRRRRGQPVPAAGSQAVRAAPRASFASSPRPHNVARRTSPGSASLARRRARLTTTPSAAATAIRTRTPARRRQPVYLSRARAPARLPDRAS